jgi:hypothetical protein
MGKAMVEVQFCLYGPLPRERAAFVADTLHTVRELGLVYNVPAQPGRYLFEEGPHGGAVVREEHELGDPHGARFAAAVEAVRNKHWPHLWMAVEIPRHETHTGERSGRVWPVTVSLRELPVADTPARYIASAYYELSMALSVEALIDVEREEDAEQGLHWFVSQVFLPLFISREALYGKADFEPTAALEVTPRHLERVLVPDFYFLNVLGPPYIRKYGIEPFQDPRINPVDLQRRWLMRTPEGALLFRAKTETARWNGLDEPPVDFYEWEGRLRILDAIRPKKGRYAKGP